MRQQYKTQLRKRVEKEIHKQYGFFRMSYIARNLKSNISSVMYQLLNFVKNGILVRIGKYFLVKIQMFQRTVYLSVVKFYRNLKKLYICGKNNKNNLLKKTKPFFRINFA